VVRRPQSNHRPQKPRAAIPASVTDGDDTPTPIACFRAPDGAVVAEVDLSRSTRGATVDLIARARSLGAAKLWVHAHVIDVGLGFTHRGAYVRLRATLPPAPIELPFPPREQIVELQRGCFGDVWGHHEPGPPADDSVFVALHEAGRWVGICEADPEALWIDGPGLLPGFRTPDRYGRLVRGAAAYLRHEPVVLETWGDSASTLAEYRALGFEVVQSVSGWELDLTIKRGSARGPE
jgi:hypothetical protein